MGLALALLGACDDGSTREPDATVVGPSDGNFELPDVGPENDCMLSMFDDVDDDGYLLAPNGAGVRDCNDCDETIGPNALEIPGNDVDEDCDGVEASAPPPPAPCDGVLEPEDARIDDAVRSLGLCREGSAGPSRRWGVVDTRWERLNGQPTLGDARQVWMPRRFGSITPREGERMLVLSTGVARDVTEDGRDAGYTEACDAFDGTFDTAIGEWSGGVSPPEGFPYDSTECPMQNVSRDELAYDDVGLTLTVRTPANARAIAFDSMFLTSEYPDYVCTPYNDFFVVLMEDAPREYENDNVLRDGEKNPIGVNSALLGVCKEDATRPARDIECGREGTAPLRDTGYDAEESTCATPPRGLPDIGGASTGWLKTEVPLEADKVGKVVTLRFLLWDSGDPLLDSTVLIDNVRFLPDDKVTPPEPGTRPISASAP